jgi:hypothetical protein
MLAIILKRAVAGFRMAHLAKITAAKITAAKITAALITAALITAAFEFSVLTLTVPGFRAENIKIHCAFNQLHHSALL